MMEYEKLTNKSFAFECLNLLIDNGLLSDSEIMILTDNDECKRLFNNTKFPVLLEVAQNHDLDDLDCYDELGRQRFYKEKIFVNGRSFIITNHWYGPNKSVADNRTPFLRWVLNKMR